MKITMLGGEDAAQITAGRPKKLKEHEDRAVENAHHAKVGATDSWVRGDIDSKKHAEIHKRADKVIKAKGHVK